MAAPAVVLLVAAATSIHRPVRSDVWTGVIPSTVVCVSVALEVVSQVLPSHRRLWITDPMFFSSSMRRAGTSSHECEEASY